MKKIYISIVIIFIIFSLGTVFATSQNVANVVTTNNTNVIETKTANDILEAKNEVRNEMDEYTRKYGSESYGLAGFILDKVRLYSIPICFVGLAVGALYQYVLGTRRLDMKHKGFGLIIASVTILVICQVLPLIFAIVVNGWRE